MKKIYLLQGAFSCALLLMGFLAQSQSTNITSAYWSNQNQSTLVSENGAEPQIQALKADFYLLGFQSVYQQLLDAQEGLEIQLPIGNGEFETFIVKDNTTMAPGLQNNFPGIRSFDVVSVTTRSTWGKMDVSHNGFRAMIFQPGKSTLFIDPVFHNETSAYMVYRKADFYTNKSADCKVNSEDQSDRSTPSQAKAGIDYNDCELNTYRIAISATGEYTQFHGGEVEDALAAQVTTMNRVNGVYERDFAVTMTMVENNELIVFDDPDTDPFTNGDTFAMIGQNPGVVNSAIGFENYDIGHVFGTDSGGLASLFSVCGGMNNKARGVTGSGAPVNDPFDIDYVAHEIGHQFGGNHTQNNDCNRNGGTAVEPGSASTIMGYAGICPPNVQSNSDDHFHGVNMVEIGGFVQTHNESCAVITPLDNSAPVLEDLEEEIYIPVGTPFVLTVIGTDVDGDELTYCWEQMDNETGFAQPPSSQSTGGPNFRSNSPITSPPRYFPSLETLANNGPYTWERLPDVERDMNFRVTARDNAPGGGCTQYDDITVTTVGEEPFKVIYPSSLGIEWGTFTTETVLWDVSNTTEMPINAQTVDIFLSIDGGVTYDIQLADDVENDGAHAIQVPNTPTNDAYIMVMNSEGTFFDVSNNDFTISNIDEGFYFNTDFTGATLCQGDEVSFNMDVVELGTFPNTINIEATETPGETQVDFSQTTAVVGDNITVTFTIPSDLQGGSYNLSIEGTDGVFSNYVLFDIDVIEVNPSPSTPIFPDNNAQGIPTSTELEWEDNATFGASYTIELSSDESFNSIVFSASGLEEATISVADLLSETTYFWRIFNITSCGSSEPSGTFSFTTFTCELADSEDVPLNIPSDQAGDISSTIEIGESGTISEVSVLNIQGSHENMADLTFTLQSPMGTEVLLTSATCGVGLTIESNGDIEVVGPPSIAGTYESSGAAGFGPNIPGSGISNLLIQALDGSANPEQVCEAAVNGDELNGKIALIMRGECAFVQKVINAQDAGAIAVIIVNNIPGDGFFNMGGNSNEIEIPSVMISYEDGQTMIGALGNAEDGFSFGFSDDAEPGDLPCPANDGGIYQPLEPLSELAGEDAQGTWMLKVDYSNTTPGELSNWELQICYGSVGVDGIEDRLLLNANVFPNPTNHFVTVQLEETMHADIALIDLAGRVIQKQTVNAMRLEVDLNELTDGVYFIQIDAGAKGYAVHKIVKQ